MAVPFVREKAPAQLQKDASKAHQCVRSQQCLSLDCYVYTIAELLKIEVLGLMLEKIYKNFVSFLFIFL